MVIANPPLAEPVIDPGGVTIKPPFEMGVANLAKHIKNMDELAKALQPTLLKMTDQLAERVYKTLNYFLLEYYEGYKPSSYQRTLDFLHSAVKVDAQPYKSGVRASVYIDTDAMNNYRNVSGYQVAKWANERLHGGMEVDHKPHVWDDTMDETVNNGELLRLAMEYLKSKGFSVRI